MLYLYVRGPHTNTTYRKLFKYSKREKNRTKFNERFPAERFVHIPPYQNPMQNPTSRDCQNVSSVGRKRINRFFRCHHVCVNPQNKSVSHFNCYTYVNVFVFRVYTTSSPFRSLSPQPHRLAPTKISVFLDFECGLSILNWSSVFESVFCCCWFIRLCVCI